MFVWFFFSDDKKDAMQLMSTKLIFSGDDHKTCSKAEVCLSVRTSHLAVTESNI